jgi:hypothetical protein
MFGPDFVCVPGATDNQCRHKSEVVLELHGVDDTTCYIQIEALGGKCKFTKSSTFDVIINNVPSGMIPLKSRFELSEPNYPWVNTGDVPLSCVPNDLTKRDNYTCSILMDPLDNFTEGTTTNPTMDVEFQIRYYSDGEEINQNLTASEQIELAVVASERLVNCRHAIDYANERVETYEDKRDTLVTIYYIILALAAIMVVICLVLTVLSIFSLGVSAVAVAVVCTIASVLSSLAVIVANIISEEIYELSEKLIEKMNRIIQLCGSTEYTDVFNPVLALWESDLEFIADSALAAAIAAAVTGLIGGIAGAVAGTGAAGAIGGVSNLGQAAANLRDLDREEPETPTDDGTQAPTDGTETPPSDGEEGPESGTEEEMEQPGTPTEPDTTA